MEEPVITPWQGFQQDLNPEDSRTGAELLRRTLPLQSLSQGTSTMGRRSGECNWPASFRDGLFPSEGAGAAEPRHRLFQRDGNSCHRTASVQMKVKESRTVVSPVISQGSQMHQQMALMKEGQLQRQE